MRKFIILFLLSPVVLAQTATKGPDEELLQNYQREYAFLAAQKQSLIDQTVRLKQNTKQKLKTAEASLATLEAQLAKLQANNDKQFEMIQAYERQRKEIEGRQGALASLWKRMKRGLQEQSMSIQLRSDAVIEEVPPEGVSIEQIAPLGQEALNLVEKSKSLEAITRTYMNKDNELAEGQVLRVGRVAAFLKHNGQVTNILAPTGDGMLKEIEPVEAKSSSQLMPIYIFESLKESLKLQKPSGWKEKLADFAPLLFLGVLFLMVAWLFLRLARI